MGEFYKKQYLPSIIRTGRIVFLLSLFLFFVPFLATWLILGIEPQWPQILQAGGTWFAMNIVFWIVEPLSFFPILGIPGSFLSGLAGNTSNMRIPCAVAAQKATGTMPGTMEGQIISTISIGISVFVNIFILVIGVLAGQAALSLLPESAVKVLDFLLPALYGCVFAQCIEGDEKSGIVPMGLAIATLLFYKRGAFNWIPFDSSFLKMVVPVFGAIALAVLREKKKHEEKK